MLRAPGDDALGENGADSGQRVELLRACRVEVQHLTRPAADRRLPLRQSRRCRVLQQVGRPTSPAGVPATPTRICSPSTTCRARSTEERSVPGSAPPAATTASLTRAEAARVTTPGCRTFPATWTTTSVIGLAPAAGEPRPSDLTGSATGCAVSCGCAAASRTRLPAAARRSGPCLPGITAGNQRRDQRERSEPERPADSRIKRSATKDRWKPVDHGFASQPRATRWLSNPRPGRVVEGPVAEAVAALVAASRRHSEAAGFPAVALDHWRRSYRHGRNGLGQKPSRADSCGRSPSRPQKSNACSASRSGVPTVAPSISGGHRARLDPDSAAGRAVPSIAARMGGREGARWAPHGEIAPGSDR